MAKIKSVQPFSGLEKDISYLLLISPNQIPHLAIIREGNYYSLTHKKSVQGEPFEPYLKHFKRSKKELLFVALNKIDEHPSTVFSRYVKADNTTTTCLRPVKEVSFAESEANFVFELIPALYAANRILRAEHLNLENSLDELGDFNLLEYSKRAIFDYIDTLNIKHAKR